jgi:regulator of sigma E protease
VRYRNEKGDHEVALSPIITGLERHRLIGISAKRTTVVGEVLPHSPAALAGLQPDDRIVSANGEILYSFFRYEEIVDERGEQPLALVVERGGETLEIVLTPREVPVFADGRTSPETGIFFKDTEFEEYRLNPFEQVIDVIQVTYRTLAALFSPRSDVGLRAMGGPVGILYMAQQSAQGGWQTLFYFILLINVNLAIINLLPLPILDGGHIVLATFKKLAGRPVPAGIIQFLQAAMMVTILFVLIYVTFFNILGIGRDERAAIEQEQSITPVFPAPAPAVPRRPPPLPLPSPSPCPPTAPPASRPFAARRARSGWAPSASAARIPSVSSP